MHPGRDRHRWPSLRRRETTDPGCSSGRRDPGPSFDNTNDALGLAFTDLINYFGVKQNVTGPTHRFNHTLDLIISHGIDLTDIAIVPQSDDVTDHFLVLCMYY